MDFEEVKMPIPDYQTLMLPFLKIISDGKEYQIQEVIMVIELTHHKLKIL